MTARDQINKDILEASKERGLTPEALIKEYYDLLPPTFDFDAPRNFPAIVKAWTALQVEKGSPLRYFYDPDDNANDWTGLGEFIYNSDMYFLNWTSDVDLDIHGYHLHYQVESKLAPEIPEGLASCWRMFKDCKLPEGFTLGDKFNTSNITDMHEMFKGCRFPEGFTFGPNFTMSKVKNDTNMFDRCHVGYRYISWDDEDKIISKLKEINHEEIKI